MSRVCVPIKSEADANQVVSLLDSSTLRNSFTDEVAKVGGFVCIWANIRTYSLDRGSPDTWASEYIKPNQLSERLKEL